MAVRSWTCQRVTDGIKCGSSNPKRNLICKTCGKRRPATKQVAHRKALEQPYEVFVAANGGSENCGICGRPPPEGGRHRRDHEHKGDGLVRGLLCWTCNLALRDFATVEWLRAAAVYLERAERRRGINLAALSGSIPPMSQSPQQPQQPDPNQDPQPAQQPDQAPQQDPNQPQQDPAPQQPEPTTTQGG